MEIWSLRGKKILVVDDLPDMRTMLRTLLVSLGAEDIKTAKDGDQAMTMMETNKFDIVLCDYNLGDGKDGQQVLEEVRHRGLLPYAALFVMITAETSTPMVMGAAEYSPDDYISKPIPKATLQTRLRKLLDKKERLRPVLHAMQQRSYTTALTQCDILIEQDPSNRFDLLRLKGELLLTMGECEKAKALYEALLEVREVPWAMLGLGKTLYYLQQYDIAADWLRRLIDSHPMVIAAYDWLSMVLEKQYDYKGAQEVLAKALERSPKSILRQRRHGEMAYRNEDLNVAERAFKLAMRVGKGSCFRGPAEFAGLARTLVKKDAAVEAVKLVDTMTREFRDDPAAQLQTSLVDSVVQQALGNAELSQQAAGRAIELFQRHPDKVGSDTAMDLAEVCFHQGNADAARDLLRHALRNQHEDTVTQKRVREMFNEVGLAEEGQALIEATAQEVLGINNRGVRLAQEGKLEESIRLFEQAATAMPENMTINLNAAQSLVMFMRERGVTQSYLNKAEIYLNRVQAVDVANTKYQKLKELLSHMVASQ
ncbi:MAG: response regulator [Methylococcaceae bacterium]|nr:MAG: response regulator [Methylococcaceae bacterium]